MLPLIIIVVVAIPALSLAFRATQRSKTAGEHPPTENTAMRERTEREFGAAGAYQEQWRENEKKRPHDTRL